MMIIAMRGLPGSGKTTLAKAWRDEDPINRVRISRDDLRSMLFGDWTGRLADEALVTESMFSTLGFAAKAGWSVVIDCTHTNAGHLNEVAWFAGIMNRDRRTPTEFVIWDVPTPVQVCIERDAARPETVGRAVIEDKHRQLKGQADWRPELGTRMWKP